ncbi:MAG: hypothetical protein LBL01_03615 [Bifidobacteriaceae bacterium]|jgi:hypothetical protein|nr:hypothetical protein [Bifidobacteriaceae bacterium]
MDKRPAFRRPASLDPVQAAQIPGGVDPAVLLELAHSSAGALVARARDSAAQDPELVARLLALVETEGVDTLAALWSEAAPDSLPGALWRVYMLREWVRRDPITVAERYRLGAELQDVARVVAGARNPPGPDEVLRLADEVLSGVFAGELDVALGRAAAFARILATGSALDADWLEESSPAAAEALTRRAAKLLATAEALEAAARSWRRGSLD